MTAVHDHADVVVAPPRDFRLIDSTLRDGSHAISHQYTVDQVVPIVKGLDAAGVQVIEVTHGDGLGGSSFNYGFSAVDEMTLIEAAVQSTTDAQIAVLLVPGIGTVDELRRARDLGVGVVRIAVHCTEADITEQHIAIAKELGMEAIGFLMMSHMNTPKGLLEQARLM
jgi:4-hydroxy 2-oxovalerate aldolase